MTTRQKRILEGLKAVFENMDMIVDLWEDSDHDCVKDTEDEYILRESIDDTAYCYKVLHDAYKKHIKGGTE